MKSASPAATFAVLVLMLALSGLDQTLLSTALPSIVRSLGGRELAPWVFSAYLLASTAVIPLYGKLADRLGARPLLLTSTALFAAGSLACASAASMPALVAARALQGLGGGGLMTLTMLATATLYPPAERGRRMGVLGAAYGLSTLVGPLSGALLLQVLPWTWGFLLNIPGALVALAVLARAELGGGRADRAPLDWPGAALLSGALVALLLASRGATDVAGAPLLPAPLRAMLPAGIPASWLLALLAALLVAAWWQVERHAADPIVPPALFTRRPFVIASVLSALSGVMLFAAVVFVPLFLQQGLALTPVQSALVTLPLMLGITVGGRLAGRALRGATATDRLASVAALALKLGYGALAATLPWLAAHGARHACVGIAVTLLPVGLGLGLLFPLVSLVAQRSAPPEHLGVATAAPVMLRALGGALGVALLGELLHGHLAANLAAGLAAQAEPSVAFAGATARIAACGAAAALAALVVSRGLPGPRHAAPDTAAAAGAVASPRLDRPA